MTSELARRALWRLFLAVGIVTLLLWLNGCAAWHRLAAPCHVRMSDIRMSDIRMSDIHRNCDPYMQGPEVYLERWGNDLVCVESFDKGAMAVTLPSDAIYHCDGEDNEQSN